MGDNQVVDVKVQQTVVHDVQSAPAAVNYRIQHLPDHVNLQQVHFVAATAMSFPGQIDEGPAGEGQPVAVPVPVQVPLIQVVDAQPIQVHYMQDADHAAEDGENDGDGEQASSAEHVVLVDPAHRGQGNQLTLSFQGEVYVFDSVAPEKVHSLFF